MERGEHRAKCRVLHAYFDGDGSRGRLRKLEELGQQIAYEEATRVEEAYAAEEMEAGGTDDVRLLRDHRAANERDGEDGDDGGEGAAAGDGTGEEMVQSRASRHGRQHHLTRRLEERQDVDGHQRAHRQLRQHWGHKRREEGRDGGEADAEGDVRLRQEGDDITGSAARAAGHQDKPHSECLRQPAEVRYGGPQPGHDGVLQQYTAHNVQWRLQQPGEVLGLKRRPHSDHGEGEAPHDPVPRKPGQQARLAQPNHRR
mmetsp:Transcript_16914/g.30198  ORF Transcript_16914/g.30198 Transcript_16914/m.30198 type:complete len:257 (-) Transcript_16914:850-1620(-)